MQDLGWKSEFWQILLACLNGNIHAITLGVHIGFSGRDLACHDSLGLLMRIAVSVTDVLWEGNNEGVTASVIMMRLSMKAREREMVRDANVKLLGTWCKTTDEY